jgi:glycosyltransferase involved in cell wall biosynthesis
MSPTSEFESDVAALLEPILCGNEMSLAYPRGRHAEFRSRPAKVGVIVPVYNGELRLQRCLESIASQTLTDFQAVIVDNCSSDRSLAIACRFAAQDPRFIVYQNARNVGRVPNWNRALDLAGGEYVKPVMVNDYLLPECLAELSAILDSHPEVVLARTSVTVLDDGKERFEPLFESTRCLSSDEVIEFGVADGNAAAGPSAQMFRRAPAAEHKIHFDPRYEWAADYEFTMRLYQWGGLFYLRKTLFVFELNTRFATKSPAWKQLEDDLEVMGTSYWRYQHRLGPQAIQRARARARDLHRDCQTRSSTPADRARCDSIWEKAQARHRFLFSAPLSA